MCLALAAAAPLSLAPYVRSSTELVRLRNALLLVDGPASDFNWTPATRPPGFAVESVTPDPVFTDAVRRLKLDSLDDDWARAVAISAHLLGAGQARVDGAIQSDLRTTYRRIVDHGEGYCADFVRSFNALAIAAGMPVRSWAFSFDGFGGHGHVFPEIWNRQLVRWQLVDPFSNLAFLDAAGRPLSAMEFRRGLRENLPGMQLKPLVPSAPVEFKHLEVAWAYFRRGADEWYLWWGERPFTYDAALAVRAFDGRARPLAQLGAIVQGVHPQIRIMQTATNRDHMEAMWSLRRHLLVLAVLVPSSLMGSILCFVQARVVRRRYDTGAGQ